MGLGGWSDTRAREGDCNTGGRCIVKSGRRGLELRNFGVSIVAFPLFRSKDLKEVEWMIFVFFGVFLTGDHLDDVRLGYFFNAGGGGTSVDFGSYMGRGFSHEGNWVSRSQSRLCRMPSVDAIFESSARAVVGDLIPVWEAEPVVKNQDFSQVYIILGHR